MLHVLHNDRLMAVIAGGVFIGVAALLMQRVVDPGAEMIRTPASTSKQQVALRRA